MKVQVNVFDENVQFSANRPVTGHHIVDYVAQKIGLKPSTGEYFSLQAFKESEQKFVWINLNKKLPTLLKSGIRFDSNLNLYFRAKLFPFNFVELQYDPVAIRLFYQQLKANFHPKLDLSVSLDTFICALFQQIEIGNFSNFDTNQELLFQALKSKIFPDNNFENFETMLKLWNMLEDMTAADAILNYLSIVQHSNIAYESVGYLVHDKINNKSTIININFDNIIIQDKEPNQTTDQLALGWHIIRKVSFQKNNLILQLLDDKLTKLKFSTTTKWAAKDMYSVIVRYHKLHCKHKDVESSATTQLLISDQNKFLRNIFQSLTEKNLPKSETAPQASASSDTVQVIEETETTATFAGTITANTLTANATNSIEFLQTLIQKCNGLNQIGEFHSSELKDIKQSVQELLYCLSLIYDSNNCGNDDVNPSNVAMQDSNESVQLSDHQSPISEQVKFIINGNGDEISEEQNRQQQQPQLIKGLDIENSELNLNTAFWNNENPEESAIEYNGSQISDIDSADLQEIERIYNENCNTKEKIDNVDDDTVEDSAQFEQMESLKSQFTEGETKEEEEKVSIRTNSNLVNLMEEDNSDINAECIKPVPVVFRRKSERIAQQRIEFFENLP